MNNFNKSISNCEKLTNKGYENGLNKAHVILLLILSSEFSYFLSRYLY